MVNYSYRYQVLSLEIQRRLTQSESLDPTAWRKLRESAGMNFGTLYDNRNFILKLMQRLEPYTKKVGKQLVVQAEAQELIKALEGLVF